MLGVDHRVPVGTRLIPDVFYFPDFIRAIKNVWRRPTLPPCGSTIGAEGLNFRVRNGNGWDPFAVITRRNKLRNEIRRKDTFVQVPQPQSGEAHERSR
jgi:hypothetical protein